MERIIVMISSRSLPLKRAILNFKNVLLCSVRRGNCLILRTFSDFTRFNLLKQLQIHLRSCAATLVLIDTDPRSVQPITLINLVTWFIDSYKLPYFCDTHLQPQFEM